MPRFLEIIIQGSPCTNTLDKIQILLIILTSRTRELNFFVGLFCQTRLFFISAKIESLQSYSNMDST